MTRPARPRATTGHFKWVLEDGPSRSGVAGTEKTGSPSAAESLHCLTQDAPGHQSGRPRPPFHRLASVLEP